MNLCFEKKHYCTHVKNWNSLDASLASFFNEGLALNECVQFYSDRWTLDTFLSQIAMTEIQRKSFRDASENGRLQFLSATKSFLVDGHFDVEATLFFVAQNLANTLGQGYSGLRVASEMQWVQKATNPAVLNLLIEYETRLQEHFEKGFLTGLCVYCEEALSPDFCFKNFHTHKHLHVIDSEDDKILSQVIVNPLKVYDPEPRQHLANLSRWVQHLNTLGPHWMARVETPSKEQFKRQIYSHLSKYIEGDDFSQKGLPDLFLTISNLMSTQS